MDVFFSDAFLYGAMIASIAAATVGTVEVVLSMCRVARPIRFGVRCACIAVLVALGYLNEHISSEAGLSLPLSVLVAGAVAWAGLACMRIMRDEVSQSDSACECDYSLTGLQGSPLRCSECDAEPMSRSASRREPGARYSLLSGLGGRLCVMLSWAIIRDFAIAARFTLRIVPPVVLELSWTRLPKSTEDY